MWCTKVTYRVSFKELYWFSLEQWFPNGAPWAPLRGTPLFLLFCQTLPPTQKSGFATWHARSISQRGRCLKFFCAPWQLGKQAVHTKGRHRKESVCNFSYKSKLSDNVMHISMLRGVPHHFCKPRSGPRHTFGWRTTALEQRELCGLFVRLSQQRCSWPLLDKRYQDPDTFSRFLFFCILTNLQLSYHV